MTDENYYDLVTEPPESWSKEGFAKFVCFRESQNKPKIAGIIFLVFIST